MSFILRAFATIVISSVTFINAQERNIPLQRIPRLRKAPPHVLSSNVSVASSHEFAYLANIEVGGQPFSALLDTGSSDLWVLSSSCSGQDCMGIAKYSPTSSLSLSDVPFRLNYLMGSVSGAVGTETVALGPFQISSQVLGLANGTSELSLAATGNSGILGLAFPSEASIPDTSGVTLLENLLSSFNDSDRYFAFKLGRDQTRSSFTVGELDPAFANSTSEFTFTPVHPATPGQPDYDYWKVPIRALTINGTTFDLSPSTVPGAHVPIAVMDTGTTLALGPSADVDRFYKSIGGTRKDTANGNWEILCSRAAIIGFVLGQGNSAKEYPIHPADLSWQSTGHDGEWCMGGIQANDDVSSGDWLLGDTFLRNVYVIHKVATADMQPSIGLLGTTDSATAMSDFTSLRGQDVTPPVPILSSAPDQPGNLGVSAICGISGASGFVVGLLIAVLVSYGLTQRLIKGA